MCVPQVLVGNKSDMDESRRAVPYSRGQALADEFKMQFFETSAKNNTNVDAVFQVCEGGAGCQDSGIVCVCARRERERKRGSVCVRVRVCARARMWTSMRVSISAIVTCFAFFAVEGRHICMAHVADPAWAALVLLGRPCRAWRGTSCCG